MRLRVNKQYPKYLPSADIKDSKCNRLTQGKLPLSTTKDSDQCKYAQLASPQKQRGVQSHNKKRWQITNPHPNSDMEESDNNIPSPTPPIASLQMSVVQEAALSDNIHDMDLDGDKTMVNDCIPFSPSPETSKLESQPHNKPRP